MTFQKWNSFLKEIVKILRKCIDPLPAIHYKLSSALYSAYVFWCLIANTMDIDQGSFLVLNHLEEEERAGCFAILVLQMSCYCKCSVALPHSAVGWSAVCDCGIS